LTILTSDKKRPSIREGCSLVQYKNKLYLFGGIGKKLNSEIISYDLIENEWLY